MLFKCIPCDFKTNNKKDYKRHLLTKTHQNNNKESESSYICEDCKYQTNSKKRYENHFRGKRHLKWLNKNRQNENIGLNANSDEKGNVSDASSDSISGAGAGEDSINFLNVDSDDIRELKISNNDSDHKIKYIIHMADIHIRLVDRHQEYNEVFDNLYNNLHELDENIRKQAVIVICGDILHQKNILSPEVIYHTKAFLTNLGKILPTIIIAGNHDANLANRNRLDSLSVMTNGVKGLYYLKDTGVYKFGNVVFGVSSVFDEYKNLFINGETLDMKSYHKVALYHGAVNGCKSSTGFKLSGVSHRAFKGFDYVLLGDIHQYQYLNKQKTMAYSSSLIQQNFGETLENHGYLFWNLDNGESKYVNIQNQYGFKTFYLRKISDIDVVNNSLYSGICPRNNIKIPAKCNIRFVICNNLINFDKDIIEIKTKYPDYSYSIMTKIGVDINLDTKLNSDNDDFYNSNISNQNNVISKLETKTESLLDIETQNKYICEILKLNVGDGVDSVDDVDGVDDTELFEKLKQINKKYNQLIQLDYDDEDDNYNDSKHISKNSQFELNGGNNGYECGLVNNWKLLFLEFENMFTYTEKQTINFRNMNGIVGIFGENHSGKSSILDIILFCLFEKTSRTLPGCRIDIINKGKKRFQCKLEFSINNDIYIIQRYNSGKSFYVNFYKNGYSMNGAKTTDTNKIIKSIIGNYNDFITMTLSLQENNDGFVYLKQSQRKDFLYRIFRLNMFEKIEKLVGYDLRNKKSEYRLLNRKIQDYDMNGEQFEEKIKELNDIVLSNITGKINDAEIKYNNVIIKLKSKNKDLQSLPFISDKYINAIKSIGVYLNDGYYNRYDNGHEYDNIDVSVMTTKELSKLIISIREYLKSENKNININKDNLIKNKEIEINNLYEDKNKSIQSELDSVILDENNELSNQKSNRSSVKKKLKKLKKEKKALLKKHPKYIEGGFGEDVPVIVTEYREFVSMKNNLMNELNMLSERHGRCIKMFEKLDGYEYNQDCEYCCKNPFVIEAENAGKESKVIDKKINDIKQKLSEINTEMCEKFGQYNSNSDGYCDINVVNIEELHNIIVNLNNKIVLCDDEISNSTKIIKFIKGKIKSLNTNAKNMIALNHKQREIEIKNIHSDYDNKNKNVLEQLKILEDCLSILRQYKKIKKNNISVTKECNTLQISAEQIKTEINDLLINKKETEIELNSIQEKFKDYQELVSDWTSLKDEIVILDLYNRAINKNGIPLYFLKKIVPEIERRINQNMSSFVDFKLHMDIDDKNINMFIAYGGNSNTEDGDGGKWNVANCCGFEKFIINLAIRIVIQNMANISKPNFIAFDEGWGCFDDKNLMNIYKIFDFMKMHYEFVLLITHIETLKNSVDRYANVIKNVDSGVSTISSTNI